MNTTKNKHLTWDDRIQIQDGLYKGMSFRSIAFRIGKDPSTISKEVKRHITTHTNRFVSRTDTCPFLLKAPFVCNGCQKRSLASCHYQRHLYAAKIAQKLYEETLVSSREGIALNKASFYADDKIIYDRLKAGQHLNQILPELSVSKSTVYRYFNLGYLSASRIDLPRAVKFKPRRKRAASYVPKGIKIGRSYADFLQYTTEHNLSSHTELDTVIGRVGGKTILTIHLTAANFMIGLLLEHKTSAEVTRKIQALKTHMNAGGMPFGCIFPVLLTDNGGEFSDVFAIEQDGQGNKEAALFFCDPMKSCQKPYIEKNHTLFRDIVPKGMSFDSFSQDTVNLIFSHVNSVRRARFHNKTPFELVSFLYGEEFPHLFGIRKIEPNKVIQTPRLQKTPEFLRTLHR